MLRHAIRDTGGDRADALTGHAILRRSGKTSQQSRSTHYHTWDTDAGISPSVISGRHCLHGHCLSPSGHPVNPGTVPTSRDETDWPRIHSAENSYESRRQNVHHEVDQYAGKHFHNVKRKGNNVTDRVFIGQTGREALDRYVADVRGREEGPNTRLSKTNEIELTPHVLRHTAPERWLRRKASAIHNKWPGTHQASIFGGMCSHRETKWKMRSRNCSSRIE